MSAALTLESALRRGVLTALSPRGARARLMILTFHQVTPEPDPLAPDLPDARLFERQMTWLRDYCNVLPLPEASARLAAGTLPARAACITFDDGYSNNLEVAAPVLRRLGLPATFFIAGGAVDLGIMWNDLVIEGVRLSESNLDLEDRGLGRFAFEDAADRRAAIGSLIGQLKYLPQAQRAELAEAVFEKAARRTAPRLMMTRAQVAALADQGFDIGAHTITHPILKTLPAADARQEISRSHAWVQEVTGTTPISFAYPNGRPGVDYGGEHVAMVAEAGFEVAVSTAWSCASRRSPRLELPRFAPWESDRAGFWLRLVKTTVKSYRPA